MKPTERYGGMIEQYLADVEFPARPRLLYEPIEYSLEGGGKRLRPMFVVTACGLFTDRVNESLPAAAAVELFHNFTLLHDDIMDNAPLRRGRPSVWNKWGPNVAILSGDSMMIYSYTLLARTDPRLLPAVTGYFNEAALKVCEGQRYDMDFEASAEVSMARYMEMIELKTSALFVGAVSMGAAIGGGAEAEIEKLRRFALEFGIAFQIQDDLLDSYGDERLGKSVGGDILEGKKTFLKIKAMEKADEPARSELDAIHRDPSLAPGEKIARVLAIYDRYGVRQAAEEEITARFAAAAGSLDRMSAPAERVAVLRDFALGLLGRTK